MRRVAATVLSCVVALAACGGETASSPPPVGPQIHVLSVELRASGRDGALTFAAHNAGAATDTLIAASCRCADDAEVVGDASIESQQTALFTRQGPHVTVTGLNRAIDPGSFVDVVLTFELAGDVPVTAEVVRPA